MIIVDRAYDANRSIAVAEKQGMMVVIPSKSNRSEQMDCDQHLYKERHLVECFFASVKVFICISTRYAKLAVSFRAAVLIAACMACLQ